MHVVLYLHFTSIGVERSLTHTLVKRVIPELAFEVLVAHKHQYEVVDAFEE